MATLLKYNGERKEVFPYDKEKGFSLEEIYELLNCSVIEAKELKSGDWLVMDEEAKLKHGWRDKTNPTATARFHATYGARDTIVGDVLECSPEEFQ